MAIEPPHLRWHAAILGPTAKMATDQPNSRMSEIHPGWGGANLHFPFGCFTHLLVFNDLTLCPYHT